MRALSLLYHDVIAEDDRIGVASGFPGGAAGSYKLERGRFAQHLAALAAAAPAARRATVHDLREISGPAPVMLTFDDGGASAHPLVSALIESAGWRAHFLITTDFIGQRGFVTRADVRALATRGHVIGSHSCSHLTGMSARPLARLVEEWRRSVDVLEDVLGEPVRTASVPFGAFSDRVAAAAAAAGITALFTSEPTDRCRQVEGCRVIGRYAVRSDTPAAVVAAFAAGARGVRVRQLVLWNLKKVAKAVSGDAYAALRRVVYR